MNESGILFIIASLAAILHATLHSGGFSIVVAPLAIATVLAFSPSERSWMLFVLILIAELLSTLPIGVISLALLTPFAIRRVIPGVAVDLSFPFFLLVVFSTVIQVAIIASVPFVLALYSDSLSLVESLRYIPFSGFLFAVSGTSAFSFIFCIALHELTHTTLEQPVRFT